MIRILCFNMGISASNKALLFLLTVSSHIPGCSPAPTVCPNTGKKSRVFTLTENLTVKEDQDFQSPTIKVTVPTLYMIAFSVGLPANILALLVLLLHTKKLPSTILLINLTITDLMLLAVLPFRIIYHYKGNDWVFGEPFCRLVTAVFYGNIYGSVLCLMFIAVDRYVALVHPFGAQTFRSRKTSLFMTVAVWVVVLSSMIPLLFSEQSVKLCKPPIITCHDVLSENKQQTYIRPYFLTLFFLCFLLPLLVVLYCYGSVIRALMQEDQRYARAIHLTVLVMLVFLGCLLPSNILLLLHYSGSYLVANVKDLYLPYVVSQAVSTFNSCIDPFIFYYVSDDFRNKVRVALCCHRKDSNTGKQASYSSSKGTQRSKVTLLSKASPSPRESEGEVA
ncbi:hypothetical protein UPYG_G00218480 [Umbra pygmaea]|uniref:G-protein coupled receptors family 1 profile domain-containing protein n=1 Tax=Umbra pygmaea TaxID=75934 RepID=A0ABD0WR08_UMBPY